MSRSEDTLIGGSSRFPATQFSAVLAAKSSDEKQKHLGLQKIVEAYWRPIYKTVRIKWNKSNEDAKDLTQAFFTNAIEKNHFNDFNENKGRFRTYIRTCLHAFLNNEHKSAQRLKRGGGQQIYSLDFAAAEEELSLNRSAKSEESPDDYFDKEWIRAIYSSSISKLEEKLTTQNKTVYFEIFAAYDLSEENRPTYDELADRFNLSATKVTNYLAFARREFREVLLSNLQELTSSEQEFHEEARTLLGISL